MDDFEKNYPDFDWKNIPAYKHPGGKDCPCPKHEYVREQIRFSSMMQDGKNSNAVVLRFCPDHYTVYKEEVIPSMPLKYRIMTRLALRMGAIKVEKLTYMQSDICFYCKFGSGGFDKKSELPPIE